MAGRDLCLLSLDGGGVRGLSSLQILKQLMEIIDPESPPKPCDYFDMIGGTSTGGLLAIMLGRLKMNVDDCINAYTALSDQIFRKKRHRVTLKGHVQGMFDSEELERAIKEIIVKRGLEEDALLKDSPDAKCKVFVCATSKETCDTVHFTSYRSPRGGRDHLFRKTRIWEACRATSAASSLFEPVTIGDYGEVFVDGAMGANNPVGELWNQAKDTWPSEPLEDNIKCLVSIGTGVPSLKAFGDNLLDVGQTLLAIATETEKTAERFCRDKSRLDDEGRYFRFNVLKGLEDIGLEDSKQRNAIIAATSRYVQSQAVFKQMKACGNNLTRRECPTAMPPPPPQPPMPAGNQHDIATEPNSLPERVTGLMYPPTGYDQRSIQLAEYKNMGRWDQVRQLEQKIFHNQQSLNGNEHRATLTSGYNIAYAELELKSLEEAAKWSNWVSNTSQRVLDIKDPFRMKAESLNGEVTHVKGQYHEAETMLGSIFARQQDSLGDEHLDTLETQQRLADVCFSLGRRKEALTRFRKRAETLVGVLGENHPHTFAAVLDCVEVMMPSLITDKLALFQFANEIQQASDMITPIHQKLESSLGAYHPVTIRALRITGGVRTLQGDFTDASDTLRRALAKAESALGADHPETQGSVACIGFLYYQQKLHGEARPWLQRHLVWIQKRKGSDHPEAAIILFLLGLSHMDKKEYADARKYLEPAAATFRKRNSPEAKNAESLLRICQMATGHFGQRKKREDFSNLMSLFR